MTKLLSSTISKRTVDGLSTGEHDTIFWDRTLQGFGVRVYPSGAKVYIVQTRCAGKSWRKTLGRHGVISADQARREAAAWIARVKSGEEPQARPSPSARPSPAPGTTVSQLADRFLEEHVLVHCKPATKRIYKSILETVIRPELGKLPVTAVTRQQVADLHRRRRNTPGLANMMLAVLRKMFNLAEEWDIRPEGNNPCKFVKRYKEHSRERFLAEDEYQRLNKVLDAAEAEGSESIWALAAIRLLMLTGCRHSEILTLRWQDVRLENSELRLADSKTGPRTVPLSPTAVEILSALPRGKNNPWVICSRKPGAHVISVSPPWKRIRKRAGLEDVRIHDLRHSFASRALALGENLPTIAKLLGHSDIKTTTRYAHLADKSVKESSSRIGDSIGAHMTRARRNRREPA